MSDLDTRQPWLAALKWDEQGMIPAIAQEANTGRVVMFAYMNRESLQETVSSGNAVLVAVAQSFVAQGRRVRALSARTCYPH